MTMPPARSTNRPSSGVSVAAGIVLFVVVVIAMQALSKDRTPPVVAVPAVSDAVAPAPRVAAPSRVASPTAQVIPVVPPVRLVTAVAFWSPTSSLGPGVIDPNVPVSVVARSGGRVQVESPAWEVPLWVDARGVTGVDLATVPELAPTAAVPVAAPPVPVAAPPVPVAAPIAPAFDLANQTTADPRLGRRFSPDRAGPPSGGP